MSADVDMLDHGDSGDLWCRWVNKGIRVVGDRADRRGGGRAGRHCRAAEELERD